MDSEEQKQILIDGIVEIHRNFIQLEAKIEAQRGLMLAIAKNSGIDISEAEEILSRVESQWKERKLVQLEDINPRFAALISDYDDFLSRLRSSFEKPPE